MEERDVRWGAGERDTKTMTMQGHNNNDNDEDNDYNAATTADEENGKWHHQALLKN
jgi:hypothetical protein